jgi:nucleoside-diphosphate-sugar epimerase
MLLASIEKLNTVGWQPSISISQGIDEYLTFIQNY